MIISHKLRFIFIPIPRTGTHAIREGFRSDLGPQDIEQESLFHQKRSPWGEIAKIKHGHIKATEIKKHIGEEVWNDYFKFTFVRNPWDRFISASSFYAEDKFRSDPADCINELMFVKRKMNHFLFQPQVSFLMDSHGKLGMDFIGRYENLQEDFNIVRKRLQLEPKKLNQVNAARYNSDMNYFSVHIQKQISQYYSKDIELFNYPSKPLKPEVL